MGSCIGVLRDSIEECLHKDFEMSNHCYVDEICNCDYEINLTDHEENITYQNDE